MILVFNLVYDFVSITDYTNITENIPTYNDINISSSFHKTSNYDPQIPPTLPISLDDLGTHVASCHRDGNSGFSQQ